MISLFFSFFWLIFHFLGCYGVKRAKNGQKCWNKICLLHFISQEPLSFIADFCKMMISSDVFFHFFKNSILCAKKGPKWKKILVTINISGIIHMIFIYGTSFIVLMCKMTISPRVRFILSKFSFLVVRGVQVQKIAKNDKKFCLLCLISQLDIIFLVNSGVKEYKLA